MCYHPLLLFNQHGDCLAAKLRPGNVSSAEDWEERLLPEPPGRPSLKALVRYKSFRYQAASWSKPRRIVARGRIKS